MNIIKQIESEQMRLDLPSFSPGDTISVHVRVVEGSKERIQIFRGVVISIKKGTSVGSFTVRKVSHGIGVERIFSLNSPSINKIELVSIGCVRRAKIYYIRKLRGKAARIKERIHNF